MKRILSAVAIVIAMLLPFTACASDAQKSTDQIKVVDKKKPGLKLEYNYSYKVKRYKRLKIDEDRLIILRGGVSTSTTDPLINQLYKLNKSNKKPIWFIINTSGGYVEAGFRLGAAMKAIDSKIYCIVDSKAYSMGAVLLQHCDYRIMQKYSDIMFHEVSFGVQGNMSFVMSQVKHTQNYVDMFDKEVAHRLGISLKKYRKKALTEWWMTAEQAVRAGVADAVLDELIYVEDNTTQSSWSFSWEKKENRFGAWLCGPESDPTELCHDKYTGNKTLR